MFKTKISAFEYNGKALLHHAIDEVNVDGLNVVILMRSGARHTIPNNTIEEAIKFQQALLYMISDE